MRTRIPVLVSCSLALFGFGLFVACGEGDEGCGPTATHDDDIQPIWDDNCLANDNVDCHIDGGEHDMLLTQGDAYDAIVDVAAVATMEARLMDFVTPGDPENSYLLHKLKGTHTIEAGGDGERMPCADAAADSCNESGDPLSDADIQLIEDWICNGAER
jgi:hypothetical protein